MFSIHSGSFSLDNREIYNVLVGYLSLPALSYWNGIDGHEQHQHESGWTIKSTSNIHLERVDFMSNREIEVTVTWMNFNAKEIAEIDVVFSRDIYLSLHGDILDELYDMDDEASDSHEEMEGYDAKIYAIGREIVHVLEQKVKASEHSSTLMIQYKTIIEQIEEDYFSSEGLCNIARRFGVAC